MLNAEQLESLARAVHRVHCAGIAKAFHELEQRAEQPGYVETDDDRTLRKNHADLKQKPDFDDRPHDEQEQNRGNARDIERKLATIGCVILPQASAEGPFQFTAEELEALSIAEHERWMKSKLDAGWKYGPVTDKPNKRHQCLVDWKDLPEFEREKDRELVRAIPQILAEVGYTAVRLPGK